MKSQVKRLAALDIGTNSFHVVIVEVSPDGSYLTLDTHKEMVELGPDVSRNFLSADTMNRAIHAMKYIHRLCENRQVETILAYATSAIRESRNGGEFIQSVIDETGIKIQAIPGIREAQLIGLAVQHAISLGEDPVLIIDIGGGSVEFIICNKEKTFFLESLKIGVSRSATQFVKNDPISKSEIEELRSFYTKALDSVLNAVKKFKPSSLVGSSGTMENIAGMISIRLHGTLPSSINQFQYEKKDLDKLIKEFISLKHATRLEFSGLDTKRVDFIVPGMILTQLLLEKTELNVIKTSSFALREGMILDFIQANANQFSLLGEFPDIRQRSIYQLLRNCNWHEKHSIQVAKLALSLFDQLLSEHGLNENDRELLGYACLTHDIGYHISHKSHHLHALYLIQHADLLGFDQHEIAIIAHVARYHRRSTPKKRHIMYQELPKDIRKRIKKLSAFMRVADGLDRSHFQNIIDLKVSLSESMITFTLKADSDPQVEIWGALRKCELFEDLFKRKLEILIE